MRRPSLLAAAGAIAIALAAVAAPAAARPHKRPPPAEPKPAPAEPSPGDPPVPIPPPSPTPAPGGPAAPSPATGDTYALVAVDIAGDADPELKTTIAVSIGRGLDRAGAAHVAPDVVQQALRAKPELVGCTSTTCLSKLGAVVGASRFVTVRVETAGASYTVELTVLTGDGPVARKKASCEVCTMSDLGELLAAKSAEAITQPAAQPVSITLATRPGGGDVAVADGDHADALRPVGKAPASLSLPPGTYLVEVKLAGYSVLRKTITVADSGAPQAFELQLAAAGDDDDDRAPRFHRWKYVAAAGAVAAIVAGAITLSYDGQQACSTPPCRQRDESTLPGAALVGVGVVAGAAAGWMFWHDRSDEHHARAALAPTRGGAAAMVTLDW